MRPDRFPKVNDVMLAEALRQLIPVAESGVRVLKTTRAVRCFRRAELALEMWTRQERGRAKKLDGPLPPRPRPFEGDFLDDPANPDPGQTIPAECSRRKKKSVKAENPPSGRKNAFRAGFRPERNNLSR